MNLNIYLFKESVTSFDQCVKPSTSERPYQLIRGDHILNNMQYEVYLAKGKPKEPDWVPFIRSYVDEGKLSGVKNKSNSVLIILKTDTNDASGRDNESPQGHRFFAVSGGHGYNLINREMIEFDFGLKTSLNCIEPNKIKSIESRSLGVQVIQNHEASNAEAEINEFGFQFDSDILRSVSGSCSDQVLGSRVTGSDNLCITTDIGFADLADKCREAFVKYRLDVYKNNFKFIEFLKYEKDPSIIDSLDGFLVNSINQRQNPPILALAFPDQIEYERCSYFEIKGLGRKEEVSDITLKEIYDYLGDKEVDIAKIKNGIRITGFDDSSNPCTNQEPFYSFLTFEKEQDNKKYILCNRMWYYIESDFISQINAQISEIVNQCETPILKFWPKNLNSKGKEVYEEGFYRGLL